MDNSREKMRLNSKIPTFKDLSGWKVVLTSGRHHPSSLLGEPLHDLILA